MIASYSKCLGLAQVLSFIGDIQAQNWVPNPSFELYDTCPSMPSFLSKPLYWNTWYCSPEYFNACAGDLGGIDSLIDVPRNGFTYQYARTGDGYSGAFCFDPQPPDPNKGGLEYREYIGIELPCPLVVGHTYDAGFYTNLAFGGTYVGPLIASSHIGMLFTTFEHIWVDAASGPFYETNHAQVYAEDLITDTLNWTLVSGTFVADSAYRYVVLGNFFENALCDTMHLNALPTLGAYYLFDDVFVEGPPEDCDVISGTGGRALDSGTAYYDAMNDRIVLNAPEMRALAWELVDVSGRLCAHGSGSAMPLFVPTSQLRSGPYVVRINAESAMRSQQVLVIR